MKEILIFAGTTEGRKLSEHLAELGIPHTICVATEYGEIVLTPHSLATVRQGRMNQEEMEKFLQTREFAAVVDATHPFATEVTSSIKGALEERKKAGNKIPYLRLQREGIAHGGEDVVYFETTKDCVKALEDIRGNILLTVGSKELPAYCDSEKIRDRLYARVLPSVESISLCTDHGIYGKRILAMQGPFTREMNEAVIRQYEISCLVTKESGISGGYPEKLEAAKRTGTQVFVIGCPREDEGFSFEELCSQLEGILGHPCMSKEPGSRMEIFLVGIGMGSEGCLTKEAEQAIEEADILLGAERLLKNICSKAEKRPYYQAGQILPYLQKVQSENSSGEDRKVAVLFSGDSGFYSGCSLLCQALKKEIAAGKLQASLKILPGISSVAYLAAEIGESYQDAAVYSVHGKKLYNLAHKIRRSPKTFLLTSGVEDVRRLGNMMVKAGLTECEVITGYRLSYEGQCIESHTPLECCQLKEEGLYTCFIKNPCAVKKKLTHGMGDGTFIRDKVPMTKEEIREVSICKLHLQEDAVVYDIGSGTGSIAVEMAALSDEIQVYAIEHKEEAASLIEKNKEKAGLENITVFKGMAPEGLLDLPAASHAFIGGSGGRLKEILHTLRQINPQMRIVMNAISMETICELREVLSMEKITEKEVVQLQANRVREVGSYHLVQSENPVWVCAFRFCE